MILSVFQKYIGLLQQKVYTVIRCFLGVKLKQEEKIMLEKLKEEVYKANMDLPKYGS